MNAYERFCREIGNLMDWGTESGQIDTSTWQVVYFKMKYSKGMSPQMTQPHFNFNEKNFAY